MARRGDQLREHILWAAKDVFLETGFERASMDAVAARAQTSKRSLYAHFDGKEGLFLAVIDLVRSLFLDRLKHPADYPGPPRDALALFCARYLDALLYEPSVQMCRISTAETSRFPEGAARHFAVLFGEVEARVAAYLEPVLALTPPAAAAAAQRLIGRLLYPRYMRALFGIEPLARSFGDVTAATVPPPVRAAVDELFDTLTPSADRAGRTLPAAGTGSRDKAP